MVDGDTDESDLGTKRIDIAESEKPEPGPPIYQFPEGGTKAWLVVLGVWCTSFVSLGYVNAFGAYETYYLRTLLSNHTPSDVAWIGSIQACAQFSATLVGGPLVDRYGPRMVLWPCSVLVVVAMMLTSLCTEYYQFILCQGLLLGLSSGFIFIPAVAVIGQYFFKKRAMAMAFASTGSPLGGIIYSVILTKLLDSERVSFGWAQRVCGFLTLLLLVIAVILIRPTSLRRRGAFILLEAFKQRAYSVQVAALFLIVLGFYTPFFYLADYGLTHGMSVGLASYMFAVINAGSFVARVLSGTLALYAGQYNIVAFGCYASAILMFCWLAITSSAGIVVLAVLYGASSGIIISLMISTLAHTAPHPSQIGTYLGMASFVIGLAGLAGTPITGALITRYGGYSQGIIFSAAVTLAGALMFTWARWNFAKDRLIA